MTKQCHLFSLVGLFVEFIMPDVRVDTSSSTESVKSTEFVGINPARVQRNRKSGWLPFQL